jgi:hypothetical protein
MSEAGEGWRRTRLLLWVGAIFLVPLPMVRFEAMIPVSRYLLLGTVTAILIVAEGAAAIPLSFFALMFGHALVYGGLLWLAASFAARGLHRAAPDRARTVALALVLAGVVTAAVTEPYSTPFAADSARASLLTVLR